MEYEKALLIMTQELIAASWNAKKSRRGCKKKQKNPDMLKAKSAQATETEEAERERRKQEKRKGNRPARKMRPRKIKTQKTDEKA